MDIFFMSAESSSREAQKIIVTLKIIRDVMAELAAFVERYGHIGEKYNLRPKDISGVNFSNPSMMQDLAKMLPAEKFQAFVIAMSEAISLENDLKNFMTYDEDKLQEFHKKLIGITQKLDKVLEGI